MARKSKRGNQRPASGGRPADLMSPASRRPNGPPQGRRTPDPVSADEPGAATGPDSPELVGSPGPLEVPGPVGAPDPIAHAAPDAEVAAARLALGTEELDAPAEEELDELATASDEEPHGRRGRGAASNGAGAVAVPSGAGVAHRVSPAHRLVGFLQGSWAELQRVQWPDRRQVIQATGVVIGFVIVAGVFLGLSDLAAEHLMDWILK